MAKKSKLLAALDAHKGRDYKVEKQKKLQKQAAKKKDSNPQVQSLDADNHGPIGGGPVNGPKLEPEEDSEGWESHESRNAMAEAVCWFMGLGPLTPFHLSLQPD